jgi:outer membrane protein assembly factor BamB
LICVSSQIDAVIRVAQRAHAFSETDMTRLTLGLLATVAGMAIALSASAAPAPLSVVDRWAGPDGGWDFSAFDPVHRRLYVSRTDGVTAVDVDTGKVTSHLLMAKHTHVALPINGGAEVLVTEGGTGSALIADAMTGQVRATVKTGSKPDAAMLEPTTGLALVMDNAGGGITLIDPKAGTAVGVIPADGALESPATDGAGKVFINVEDKGEIIVVDMKTRAVVAHYKLDGCESPSGLAYAPAAGLLISACANNVAKVVSASDGHIVKTLTIGGRPDAAHYDDKLKLAYIPTGADGVLNVISVADAADVTIIEKAPTQAGSRSGAVDPANGRVYLPSAKFAPPVAPATRPTAVPGSFQILVLDRK